MKSLIYYKGHDIYELYDNIRKSKSSECCICLEGENYKTLQYLKWTKNKWIIQLFENTSIERKERDLIKFQIK
jgi:hypothetical protein